MTQTQSVVVSGHSYPETGTGAFGTGVSRNNKGLLKEEKDGTMAITSAYQQYQESQVQTASRGKLLLMAYDGAIRFVRQAQTYMAAKDYENQNTCIMKAQRMILELISTLDMKVGGDLAHRLAQIYEYIFNRLIEANIADNPEALEEAQRLLTDLRTAWGEADRRLSRSDSASEERHAAAVSAR